MDIFTRVRIYRTNMNNIHLIKSNTNTDNSNKI